MKSKIYIAILIYLVTQISWTQELPRSLEIANPNPVGSGARALGMGNAFIAIADDATAASWNPAGLTQLVRPELSFAVESVSFAEESHLDTSSTDKFNVTDFNYASFVYPFHVQSQIDMRNMVISLSYLNLFRFDKDLNLVFNQPDSTFGGTASLIGNYELENDGALSVVATSIGVVLSAHLFVGFSFHVWNDDITGNSAFSKREFISSELDFGGGFIFPVNPLLDRNIYEVDEGYSFVLGMQYEPTREWSIGAVFKPSYDLKLDHKRVVVDFESGIPTTILDQKLNAELEFPWIVGIGIVWKPDEQLKISTDVTWTEWSNYEFRQQGVASNPLLAGSSERSENTYTVRIGGEFSFDLGKFRIPARAGIGYDPAPTVDRPDDYYTISFGSGLRFPIKAPKIQFDLAYELRWGNNVNEGALAGFDSVRPGKQDLQRHRILTSLIYYF